MTKRDKRIFRLINGKQDAYDFADVRNLLEHYGFTAEINGSSHCIFRRQPYPHITLVVHHNKIKAFYVKRAIEILKEYDLIQ
jgi:predicted RNA binding protein YcfA (HicA-like mRNA interferase family)